MLLGVPREVRLTSAKETFMLDCRAAGFSPRTMRRYRDILSGFVNFTGDMLVRELGPDHVRLYIADLSDRGHYARRSSRVLKKHYAVIRTWVRWMYAQKIVTQRTAEYSEPPRNNRGGLFYSLSFLIGSPSNSVSTSDVTSFTC
jgi:site-specific recombinase XerD